jgi:hypothetical protein
MRPVRVQNDIANLTLRPMGVDLESVKFLNPDTEGIIFFDEYFSYLEQIRDHLPNSVKEFALDEHRYELNGPKTLHDGWLVAVNLARSVGVLQELDCTLTLKILLATHETTLTLIYEGVSNFVPSLNLSNLIKLQVDLLVHEFQLVTPELLQHSLRFADESIVTVRFKRFSVIEQSQEKPS